MPMSKIMGYACLRCGHTWLPRKGKTPKWCPSCKTPYWDKPRRPKQAKQESKQEAQQG